MSTTLGFGFGSDMREVLWLSEPVACMPAPPGAFGNRAVLINGDVDDPGRPDVLFNPEPPITIKMAPSPLHHVNPTTKPPRTRTT